MAFQGYVIIYHKFIKKVQTYLPTKIKAEHHRLGFHLLVVPYTLTCATLGLFLWELFFLHGVK